MQTQSRGRGCIHHQMQEAQQRRGKGNWLGLRCLAHSSTRQRAQVVCALYADTLVPMAQMALPGWLGDNMSWPWPLLPVAE